MSFWLEPSRLTLATVNSNAEESLFWNKEQVQFEKVFLTFYQGVTKIPEVTCWVFKENKPKQKEKKKKEKGSKFSVYGKEKDVPLSPSCRWGFLQYFLSGA